MLVHVSCAYARCAVQPWWTVPAGAVHAMDASLAPAEAAEEYSRRIAGRLPIHGAVRVPLPLPLQPPPLLLFLLLVLLVLLLLLMMMLWWSCVAVHFELCCCCSYCVCARA